MAHRHRAGEEYLCSKKQLTQQKKRTAPGNGESGSRPLLSPKADEEWCGDFIQTSDKRAARTCFLLAKLESGLPGQRLNSGRLYTNVTWGLP